MDESHDLVKWLWSILESFSNAERVLFMRFVSGRSRLPANLADFSQRFQVMKVDRPLNGLPTAQTCFFQLRLPPYSSKVKESTVLFYSNPSSPFSSSSSSSLFLLHAYALQGLLSSCLLSPFMPPHVSILLYQDSSVFITFIHDDELSII